MKAKVHLPMLGTNAADFGTAARASRFNLFVERDDYVWCFNSKTTALARLTREEHRRAIHYLEGLRQLDTNDDVCTFLVRGGFLVRDETDELESLKLSNRTTRFGARGPGLVIAPTLRCNFECPYCYVDLNANNMSPEARARVKRFFDRKLQPDGAAAVCWTGGDPSLALEVVEDLSEHFIKSCDARGGVYDAVMITNGYRLNDEMLSVLQRARIKAVQITLDGNRAAHNERRHTHAKGATYDRILDNMVRASEVLTINLRINVDRVNRDGVEDIFVDLEQRGLSTRVRFYFANLAAVNDHCSGYDSRCMSAQEFAHLQPSLMRRAMSYGMRPATNMLRLTRDEFCGANSSNYYVIDPDAQLLKCYNDLGTGDRNGIGYISDDGIEVIDKKHNLVRWLGWDPFEIDECRGCKVLPLCMGGCSYARVKSGPGAELGCITMKYNADEIIDLFGKRLYERAAGDIGGAAGCSGPLQ